MASDELFLAYLGQFDDAAWLRVVDRLGHAIHPVDQAATRIWFHVYPLRLQRALDAADDPAALARRVVLQGRWRLADQVHTSHRFLYGHRFWPEARDAIVRFATGPAAPGSLDLAAQVQALAAGVASRLGVDLALSVGITAVALRTLQQVGLAAFEAAPREVSLSPRARARTAGQGVAARARNDRQGLFGFLRGETRWTITFDEDDPEAQFPLIDSQHITTAAGLDRRDHRLRDERCSEGPIPVHCRAASCGTCWVGVLGGAERLSPMDDRERQTLVECGYLAADEERPVIRLACMAQASGAVALVIPPWNGRLKKLAGRVE
jgi:ferredoxin